jgi:hypothetical protein
MEESEMRGDLVRSDAVRQGIYTASRQIRNIIQAMPARIHRELATISDSFEIQIRLEKEVSLILIEAEKLLSKGVKE